MKKIRRADAVKAIAPNVCAFLMGMYQPSIWTSPFSAAFASSAGVSRIPAHHLFFGFAAASFFGRGGLGVVFGGALSYLLSRLFQAFRPENEDAGAAVAAWIGCLTPYLFSLFRMDAYFIASGALSSFMAMAAAPVLISLFTEKTHALGKIGKEVQIANALAFSILLSGVISLSAPAGLFAAGLFSIMLSINAASAALSSLICAFGMILGGLGAREIAVLLISSGAVGLARRYGVWAQAATFLIGIPLSAYLGGGITDAFLSGAALVYPFIPSYIAMRVRNRFFEGDTDVPPAYSVIAFRQHKPPEGVRISGDSGSIEKLDGERMLFMLADGMGVGKPAREMSRRAIDAARVFIRANVEEEYALDAINRLTMNGSTGERYSTLDMCIVDLYSGRAQFYKSGGEAAWIIREKNVIRIESESLPVGVLFDAPPMKRKIRLKGGDTLFMATDGLIQALGGADSAECALIRNRYLSPSAICRNLMKEAHANEGGARPDDMSVLCARLQKRAAWDIRENTRGVIALPIPESSRAQKDSAK